MARQLIVSNAVDLWQPVAQGSVSNYVAGQALPVNIPVRNVGLLKRFIIEITGVVNCAAAHRIALTPVGGANILSNVTLTDLNNQTRISTTGWHLHALATFRRQLAYGAAFYNTDSLPYTGIAVAGATDTVPYTADAATAPLYDIRTRSANRSGIGNNLTVPNSTTFPNPGCIMSMPGSTINVARTFQWFYEVPVSYSDTDLSGAIWAQVLNATMNLQFTINPVFFAASGADATQSVYICDAAIATTLPVISSFNYVVYQNVLDQLPVDPQTNQVILPPLDLEYVYLLNTTNVNGLSVNNAQAIPFANWRSFLSTMIMYDNNGVLNPGTDVTSIAIQSANFTNLLNVDPYILNLFTRNKINDDLWNGTYYLDHRSKPINTLQYGNMQILFTPSAVGSASGSILYVAYESLALQGAMSQASSVFQS
jgi:hypothetical protein